jgi:thymidylate synthase
MKAHQHFFEVHRPEDLKHLEAEILKKGTQVSPRDKMTKEIRNIVVKFDQECNFAYQPDTKGMAEEDKKYYISDMKFANMRVTHIRHKVEYEINETIKILDADAATRRARIIEADYAPYNIPCLLGVQFFRRNGTLETSVFLRSSNVVDVLPLDMYAMGQIRDDILNHRKDKSRVPTFNLERGPITALISSAHVYLVE